MDDKEKDYVKQRECTVKNKSPARPRESYCTARVHAQLSSTVNAHRPHAVLRMCWHIRRAVVSAGIAPTVATLLVILQGLHRGAPAGVHATADEFPYNDRIAVPQNRRSASAGAEAGARHGPHLIAGSSCPASPAQALGCEQHRPLFHQIDADLALWASSGISRDLTGAAWEFMLNRNGGHPETPEALHALLLVRDGKLRVGLDSRLAGLMNITGWGLNRQVRAVIQVAKQVRTTEFPPCNASTRGYMHIFMPWQRRLQRRFWRRTGSQTSSSWFRRGTEASCRHPCATAPRGQPA